MHHNANSKYDSAISAREQDNRYKLYSQDDVDNAFAR